MLSLLIVEPDADTRLLYKTVLQEFVNVVFEAEDGAEALGRALCVTPELIVTETKLPRLDGFALCHALRVRRATNSAGIVVVTGSAYPADVARASTAGADEVLVKPCWPDQLIAAVKRASTQRRVRELQQCARGDAA